MSDPSVETRESPEPRQASTPRTAPQRLSRTIINFWLDCALLITFLLLAFVSAVLQFLFPAGAAADEWTLWGGNVIAWRNFQFVMLCTLAFGVLLHLMLHWSWVCGVISKRLLKRAPIRDDGSQTLFGVGVLVVVLHVLGIALLVAWASIERVGNGP